MKPAVLSRAFPAKLLLLGEYTVLSGSRALALPIDKWHGHFVTADFVDERLSTFADYIGELGLFPTDAVTTFKEAVNAGLQFDSNIPNGYGVGSSGALCAATYEQFFNKGNEDPGRTREILAGMESFFHGRSSGMDPLVSLMQAPVLREDNTYPILRQTSWPEGIIAFLVDSGQDRSTGHLVELYLNKCKNPQFVSHCLRPLTESVDHAISFFIDGHTPMLWDYLKLISRLQFQYFPEMIHSSIHGPWKNSLDQDDVSVKLCGAGGGGFYLGFASDESTFEGFVKGCRLSLIRI